MGDLGGDWQDGGAKRDTREAEPSMEDILSSIKRIIAEDAEPSADKRERKPARMSFAAAARAAEANAAQDAAAKPAAASRAEPQDDVLELNESMADPNPTEAAQASAVSAAPRSTKSEGGRAATLSPELVSNTVLNASRSKLDELSKLVVKPEVTGTDTLEGMVREMLRPMLSEWLDANLPRLVETMVAREIARITSGQI